MYLTRTVIAWSIVVLLISGATLFAQSPTAVVNGTVVDPSGASVPDARVTILNQDTNIPSVKNTSQDGTFTIINLLPGSYTLTVEKTGFKKAVLPAFRLDVNQTLTQTLTLQVGAQTEAVTVSADSVSLMLQRSSTEMGTTIDEEPMHELPLNGRNFTELLITQPGMGPINTAQNGNGIGSADSGNIGIPTAVVYRPSANGAGNRSNAFYLDGIINTDNRGGAWSIQPIADTIQEFKVQSHNNDVEYGNVLGAVINIITKSGTNQFHGSAWDFARSAIFDARNPFTGFCTPSSCPTQAAALNSQVSAGTLPASAASAILTGTPTSPLGYFQNTYGGTLGGPIIRNKTFFYFGYEGWQFSQPQNALANVPTAQELSGDFSGTVSPELIGTVNSTKTAINPSTIYNPFAESGANSAVPFTCNPAGSPMSLQNPGLSFGQQGYGIQSPGGVPCNKIPSGLIDQKLAQVISAYTGPTLKNCSITPSLTFALDNCLDARSKTDVSNNFDFRVDHHFSEKNTVFARLYMLWDTDTGIVAGTSSLAPSPYHVWNIGGAWDHVFNPNLILEVRGGINARPVLVNQTNSLGLNPESSAGFSNLSPTSGFYLTPSGYPSVIGNVGTENRANPESDVNAMMTWSHGKHNIHFGGSYLYENRLQINTYEQFSSSATQTCPTNASGLFACGANQGNALASMLLDLPSALTVNAPPYSEVHLRMAPLGFFVQDEWHVLKNLTIDVGLRYDYVPAVKLLVSNGETINALNLPAKEFIIGSAETAAYSTGCATPQKPPCVPGGLSSSNPAFIVTAGGVTYNTVNNIVFSPNSQPASKAIRDNIGPRLGIAWSFLPNTVLRVGYGIFYDTMSYRSQNSQNTLGGSEWPWTQGVSDTLNNAPLGTVASPSISPICNSAASCGPYGGYGTSQLTGLVGSNPIVVTPTPWATTGYTNDPSYSDPRSQQWNLQIERQLGANSMASIAYVGSRTQRLDWCCKANYPQGGPFCQNNPNQGFNCPTTPLTPNQITQMEFMPFSAQGWNYAQSNGYSTYNSLQAQFQKRYSQGLQTLVAFTWQKCLGDSNGDYGAENGYESAQLEYYFNAHLSKGVCAFNVPIMFNWSTVYEMPFGHGKRWLNHGLLSRVLGNWSTNYSFLARSGQAFNPSWGGASNVCTLTTTTNCVPASIGGVAPTGTDPANLSDSAGSITGYSRPSVLPGCNLKPANQSVTEWYNPACFVSPASLAVGPGYGFGDAAVGGMRTMRWINVDVALTKIIAITDTKKLQFRAEAFNVFNHMVLGEPGVSISPSFSGGTVTYGSAGVISSIANSPRDLQLALKFMF